MDEGDPPLRVAMMDDDPSALMWNAGLLIRDPRTVVCGKAETPEALLAHVTQQMAEDEPPDAIVLDAEYRHETLSLGLLIVHLRDLAPEAAVVCLSQYGDPHDIHMAVLAGARAFLLKDEIGPALATAVVRACRARFVHTPSVQAILRGEFQTLLWQADQLERWQPHPGLTDSLEESVWLRVMYSMRAPLAAQEVGKRPGTLERYVTYAYEILDDDWPDRSDLGGINWNDLSAEDRAFVLFTQPPHRRRR
jgi:DNA-binding NarL/FixJ family response regulator